MCSKNQKAGKKVCLDDAESGFTRNTQEFILSCTKKSTNQYRLDQWDSNTQGLSLSFMRAAHKAVHEMCNPCMEIKWRWSWSDRTKRSNIPSRHTTMCVWKQLTQTSVSDNWSYFHTSWPLFPTELLTDLRNITGILLTGVAIKHNFYSSFEKWWNCGLLLDCSRCRNTYIHLPGERCYEVMSPM